MGRTVEVEHSRIISLGTQPASLPAASASVFIGTFGAVLALIVFFLLFDTFVARIDQAEARSRALSDYREGMAFLAAGRVNDAADQFRTASAMDRNNTVYEIALARAVLRQGDIGTAEQLLRSILQRDPTDGVANVLLARVLVGQRRIEDAIAYYHRAVYSRWRSAEGGSSVQARLELIDLLASTKAREQLLAELLAIQDQPLGNSAQRDHFGYLFLIAGSPSRAAEAFRQAVRANPQDFHAYAGLGEASLELGEYATAASQLTKAKRLAPGDTTVADRLAIAHVLAALDPSLRGLRLKDRYERSRSLLRLTLETVARCPLDSVASASAVVADSALSAVRSGDPSTLDELFDRDVSLAQRLWNLAPAQCDSRSSIYGRALALLDAKLAR